MRRGLCCSDVSPIKFQLNPTYSLGGNMLFEGHLRYLNEPILAILNLHVAIMPLTKFGLNLIYNSGADVV